MVKSRQHFACGLAPGNHSRHHQIGAMYRIAAGIDFVMAGLCGAATFAARYNLPPAVKFDAMPPQPRHVVSLETKRQHQHIGREFEF